MANITQAAFCRLDQVLLTFSGLYMHYHTALQDPEDQDVKRAILESLDRRWANSDQEVVHCSRHSQPVFLRQSHFIHPFPL